MIKNKQCAKYPKYVYLILSKDEDYYSAIYYRKPLWRKGTYTYVKRFLDFEKEIDNCTYKRDVHWDYGYQLISDINSEKGHESHDLYQFKNMRECLKFIKHLRLLKKLEK